MAQYAIMSIGVLILGPTEQAGCQTDRIDPFTGVTYDHWETQVFT